MMTVEPVLLAGPVGLPEFPVGLRERAIARAARSLAQMYPAAVGRVCPGCLLPACTTSGSCAASTATHLRPVA